jgi:MFS transporter, DHA3 family, macrolide efflux protein
MAGSRDPRDANVSSNPARVLRNRNFAHLFLAGTASTSGFSLGQVALTWLVFTTTRSAIDVAYLALASTVASTVLSLVGGTLADRQDRRRLMILSDLSRALGLAILSAYLYLAGFSLPLVLGVSFVLGAFSTIFDPAQRALTPKILKADEVADANGLVQVTTSVFQSVASAAGGAIVAVIGAAAALGLNSATFAISAALIASMVLGRTTKSQLNGAPSLHRRSFVSDVGEGIRYISSKRGLLYLTVSAGFLNLFFAMMTPFVVVYAAKALNGGAPVYGSLLAAYAIGLGPGALMVGRTRAVAFAGKVWGFTGFLEGIAILILALSGSFVIALAAFLGIGILSGYGNVTWLSAVQLIVPSETQGRYFGVDQLGSFVVVPVGQVIGALVIQTLGIRADFLASAIGASLISLGFLLSREMRGLGYVGPDMQVSSNQP